MMPDNVYQAASIEEVLAYYADQAVDDSRPALILLGLCTRLFPEKRWRVVEATDWDDETLCFLRHIVADDGTTAEQMIVATKRKVY